MAPNRLAIAARVSSRFLEAGAWGADECRHRAVKLILVHELMRLRDLVEVEETRHDRLHLALDHETVRATGRVGIREVRADDLLLSHPQVAHVEVEVVACGRRTADDDTAVLRSEEDACRESGFANVLEDHVRAFLLTENVPNALPEALEVGLVCGLFLRGHPIPMY